MKTWNDLTEDQKEEARARYQTMTERSIGTMTVLGKEITLPPMDPAKHKGITVDEYLEDLYAQAPRMLKLAERLAPMLEKIQAKR